MGSPLWAMSCKTRLSAGLPEERPHRQVHGHRRVRGHPRPLRRRGVHQQSRIVQVCLPTGNSGDRQARMSRSRWVWGWESHLSSWEVRSIWSTQKNWPGKPTPPPQMCQYRPGLLLHLRAWIHPDPGSTELSGRTTRIVLYIGRQRWTVPRQDALPGEKSRYRQYQADHSGAS